MNDMNGNMNGDMNVPDDAPPDLKIMAENLSDILTPIKTIRGEKYHKILLLMMCTHSQFGEIESIACESTRMVHDMAQEFDMPPLDKENLINGSVTRHEMVHFFGETINKQLAYLAEFIEELDGFKDFNKDLTVLLNRIKRDWKDKGH